MVTSLVAELIEELETTKITDATFSKEQVGHFAARTQNALRVPFGDVQDILQSHIVIVVYYFMEISNYEVLVIASVKLSHAG